MSLCTVFEANSSNIDEVLSINPSANVFVFGDFNVHQKEWLNYSDGTDKPSELCYDFSISNDLTLMVKVSTMTTACDSFSAYLLNLFISFGTGICSTMAFPPFRNSDHLVFSVSFKLKTRCPVS